MPRFVEPDRNGAAAAVMTLDEERWAEAVAVHRQHGVGAPLHVATRIGELAAAGDAAGVQRWREIAFRLDGLMRTLRQ